MSLLRFSFQNETLILDDLILISIPTKLCHDEQKKKYSRPAPKQDRFCQHKNLTDQCLKVFISK